MTLKYTLSLIYLRTGQTKSRPIDGKCCTVDIKSWMFKNKLNELNEDKSDALLVSSSHPSKKPLPLSVGDEKIVTMKMF